MPDTAATMRRPKHRFKVYTYGYFRCLAAVALASAICEKICATYWICRCAIPGQVASLIRSTRRLVSEGTMEPRGRVP
jgi:hypothetical protein